MPDTREIVVPRRNITFDSGSWDVFALPNESPSSRQERFRTFSPTQFLDPTTQSDNASLKFAFNGTSIHLFGTANVTVSGDGPNIVWECFVDGRSIGAAPSLLTSQPRWLLCEKEDLSPGSHEVSLRVTKNTGDFTFAYASYHPLPGALMWDQIIKIQSSDSMCEFSTGLWSSMEGDSMTQMTNDTKAEVSCKYIGDNFYGMGPRFALPSTQLGLPYPDTHLSVDSRDIEFKILPAVGASTEYNQVSFSTGRVYISQSWAPHQLVVKYGGPASSYLLTLNHAFIRNISAPLPLIESPPPSHPKPSARPVDATHVVYIALMVIVPVLGVAIGGFLIYRHWRRRAAKPKDTESLATPQSYNDAAADREMALATIPTLSRS